MSEWGKIVFYYDYERPNKYGHPKNFRGLISKGYPWPGVMGMILHAYYGIRYFLERWDNKSTDFDQSCHCKRADDRAALNIAFDVFFDHRIIKPGWDSVLSATEQWKPGLNEANELTPQNKNYRNLFCGDESYGVFYICFTGNIKAGYSLKYNYLRKGEIVNDLQEAVKEDFRHEGWEEGAIPDVLFEAVSFFADYANLLDLNEIINVEAAGYELIKELMSE